MITESSIPLITKYMPHGLSQGLCSPAEVYEKILYLGPFSDEENKMIAKCMNHPRWCSTQQITLRFSDTDESPYYISPEITVKDFKKFINDASIALQNVPLITPVYLTLDVGEEDEAIGLNWSFKPAKASLYINSKVIEDIEDSILAHRKTKEADDIRNKKRVDEEKKNKQREADILTLITRLQNKEITPEEFKTLSEAL